MLKLLAKYSQDRGIVTPPGFGSKDIRWAIVCDEDGTFLNVVELGDAGQKKNRGKLFRKCPVLTFPEMKAGGIAKSHFLADSIDIVTLFGAKPNDTKKKKKHAYFIKLLKDAAKEIPDIAPAAVCLANEENLEQIRQSLEQVKAKPADKITFQIGSRFLLNLDSWHEWWTSFRESLKSSKKSTSKKRKQTHSRLVRGFVTGELVNPVKTHDKKIKGLADVGGRAMGDVLVGFDKDAFESYGLKQSLNAAVSEEAASTYCTGLNDLIRNAAQRLAGTKVIHWFKKQIPPEDDPLYFLEEPVDKQDRDAQYRAKELLKQIETGKRTDLLGNVFYALTLSGAGGRVMVRDWMEGQFEELVRNIDCWFDDLTIVRREGDGLAPPPKFYAVLGAAVRKLDDLSNPFVSKMWRVAVRGEFIPQYALAQSIRRFTIGVLNDDPFNHARMGLIKAYHVRKNRLLGGNEMSQNVHQYLNEEHPNPAYQCGRLMAVLARLQRSALGDVGAGVVQRYYAAASSTPALVLGRLTRTSQFHLNKLEGGLAHWYEDKIAEIWSRFKDEPPRTLDLEEQSLFALGYYQQLADMRKKKVDNSNNEKEDNNE